MKWKSCFGKLEILDKIGKDRCLILCLAGILLLVIATPTSIFSRYGKGGTVEGTMDKAVKAAENTTEGNSAESYASYLENRLCNVLSKIKGVGKTKVFVSVESSAELVVEKDAGYTRENLIESDTEGGERNQTNMADEAATIYVKDSEGNETPFVTKKLKPAITGILVVCEGGGDEQVKKEVSEALQALFTLKAHKIKVVKMKTE